MAINFAAASTAGLNNPGTEIITLVKDEGGNFVNPPSYDKMRAYLQSGEVPMLFVTDAEGKTGDIYQFSGYSETENKIRFGNDTTTIAFSAGASAPAVTDVVPKPLTYDYMPEGYPKKTMQTTTVMAEQELAFASAANGMYVALMDTALELVGGQTYTVSWDGTEYECVFFYGDKDAYLGNKSIEGGGEDTGEPFLYDFYQKAVATLDTSASHTMGVKTTQEVITPMAEEFLPAAALITYDSSTNTYSSDLAYYELYERLFGGKQVVLHQTVDNQYLYLTKWAKNSSGTIDLAFAGENYSITLNTDGTIVSK